MSAPGPTLIPASRYTSPAWLARELDAVFRRVWLLAAHASELAGPGAFSVFEVAGESVLIARDASGTARAFYNVCRHRGAVLCAQRCGRATTFRCAYHHWEYGLDGVLVRAPGAGAAASAPGGGALGLAPVACAERFGFVWVCLAEAPDDLDEFLAPVAAHLGRYHPEGYRLATENVVDIAANWKASVDVNNEHYHLGTLHAGLLDVADERGIAEEFLGPHSAIRLPLGHPSREADAGERAGEGLRGLLRALGIEGFPPEGRVSDVRPAIARAYRARAAADGVDLGALSDDDLASKQQVHVFPNVQLNFQPFRLEMYRHRPHATEPGRCWFDEVSFARPGNRPAPTPQRRTFRHGEHGLGAVMDADVDMLPRLQAGARSRGLGALRLTERERCIAHMHRTLERYLGQGADE